MIEGVIGCRIPGIVLNSGVLLRQQDPVVIRFEVQDGSVYRTLPNESVMSVPAVSYAPSPESVEPPSSNELWQSGTDPSESGGDRSEVLTMDMLESVLSEISRTGRASEPSGFRSADLPTDEMLSTIESDLDRVSSNICNVLDPLYDVGDVLVYGVPSAAVEVVELRYVLVGQRFEYAGDIWEKLSVSGRSCRVGCSGMVTLSPTTVVVPYVPRPVITFTSVPIGRRFMYNGNMYRRVRGSLCEVLGGMGRGTQVHIPLHASVELLSDM